MLPQGIARRGVFMCRISGIDSKKAECRRASGLAVPGVDYHTGKADSLLPTRLL